MTHDIEYYAELGYPLTSLPRPGHAVSYLDVRNVVCPLLRGAEAILSALAEAQLGPDATGAALELVAGHLQDALHVLDRWHPSAQA